MNSTTTQPNPTTPRSTGQWLVDQRNAGATPEEIADLLVRAGWSADAAADTALRSLRSVDRHRLLYHGLCWGAGLGSLALGSALHLAIANPQHLDDRTTMALAITVAIVLLPIAATCGYFVHRVEHEDRFAVFSPTRRTLFGWLAGCTAVVGISRLITYLYQLVSSLVGASGEDLGIDAFGQVAVTLVIAVPLFAWSIVQWRRSNVALRSLGRNVGGNVGDGPGLAAGHEYLGGGDQR